MANAANDLTSIGSVFNLDKLQAFWENSSRNFCKKFALFVLPRCVMFELEQIKTGCMYVSSRASFIWLITHFSFSLRKEISRLCCTRTWQRATSSEDTLLLYTLPECRFLRPNVLNSIEECGEPTSTPASRKRRSSMNIAEEASTSSDPRKKLNKKIFLAQRICSTIPLSLMSPTTRNFHLEVFIKQKFVIFQTVKPTEIFRILRLGDDVDLSKPGSIHRKKPTLSRDPFECPRRRMHLSQSFEAWKRCYRIQSYRW